ncbi:hypothetical protein [Nocardioides plantarum]|uniref:Uncharacterized protein n=1 Tax=Nocardioides plantarum TaxID=29299 RepID=A0ABV5K7H6_9ACTN|nr:hypothetical protein [Nocardioides plantarum]
MSSSTPTSAPVPTELGAFVAALRELAHAAGGTDVVVTASPCGGGACDLSFTLPASGEVEVIVRHGEIRIVEAEEGCPAWCPGDGVEHVQAVPDDLGSRILGVSVVAGVVTVRLGPAALPRRRTRRRPRRS